MLLSMHIRFVNLGMAKAALQLHAIPGSMRKVEVNIMMPYALS